MLSVDYYCTTPRTHVVHMPMEEENAVDRIESCNGTRFHIRKINILFNSASPHWVEHQSFTLCEISYYRTNYHSLFVYYWYRYITRECITTESVQYVVVNNIKYRNNREHPLLVVGHYKILMESLILYDDIKKLAVSKCLLYWWGI